MITHLYHKVANSVVGFIGKVNWDWLAKKTNPNGRYYRLTDEDQAELRELLKHDYYIILTRRNNHLSTYAINLSHFWLSRFRRWGYYGHTLMNTEDRVDSDEDFRLMEATGKAGVGYADFSKVFDCDSVALLKPKAMTLDEWTAALDRLKTYEGRTYDTLYDLQDDTKLSCVELVRAALKAIPNYEEDFADFEHMIAEAKNLDPHMFYVCKDFTVVWERRR